MKKYYLAVDIGASSGRHILAHMEKGKLVIEEMYRFWNGMSQVDDELCWDVDQLFKQIKEGMKKCFEAGKIPVSMGIDTWAVDFVLLDEKEERIGNAVSYRDERTEGMDTFVYQIIPEKELYSRTGIQKQRFNTVYQLMALQKTTETCKKDAPYSRLFPLFTHRKDGYGVHQCHNDPACQPCYENVGSGIGREIGISGRNLSGDQTARDRTWNPSGRDSKGGWL